MYSHGGNTGGINMNDLTPPAGEQAVENLDNFRANPNLDVAEDLKPGDHAEYIDEEESEAGEWMFAGVASDEQARELWKYDDYEDFLVATGPEVTGLRTYLQKEGAKRRAQAREEKQRQRESMTEEEYAARLRAGGGDALGGGSPSAMTESEFINWMEENEREIEEISINPSWGPRTGISGP